MFENVRKCLELLPVSYHLYRMARRALNEEEKAQLLWFLKSGRHYECMTITENFFKMYASIMYLCHLFYSVLSGGIEIKNGLNKTMLEERNGRLQTIMPPKDFQAALEEFDKNFKNLIEKHYEQPT